MMSPIIALLGKRVKKERQRLDGSRQAVGGSSPVDQEADRRSQ